MPKVIIIGGGIAGMAAAVHLKAGAKVHDKQVDVLVLEKGGRIGGKILTEKIGDYLVEAGPDSFLPEKVQALHLARQVGLEPELLPSNDEFKGTFIFSGGKLHTLPEGVMLMVPTMFWPMVKTSLISWPGKLRMGMEMFIPKRKQQGDESLASFVTRRLGRECLEKIAEPLVAGIHTSNPDNMSVMSTFPRFLQMEQKSGSLIHGMISAMKNRPHATLSGPAKARPGAPKMTYFMSFRKGMQELSEACVTFVGKENVRLNAGVKAIEPKGKGYAVVLENGETLEADHVMLGTAAYDAAEMIREFAPEPAEHMKKIDWSSSGNISLAFRRADLNVKLKGFGFIVPKIENRRINAATYSSIKWSYRAPDDLVMMRIFMGGGNREDLVYDLDDKQMIQTVLEELDVIVGLKANPQFSRIYRWNRAMPKYTVGHMDRMALLDRLIDIHPGLHLIGCSYKGIGIGGCVAESQIAAEKILKS
ncbi:MAG: protoporphyrinogen oxidase [Nitrospiraceae bacterium]|nr:protoporphyrinogen oxidase [Nitrospiraceae bacterium]